MSQSELSLRERVQLSTDDDTDEVIHKRWGYWHQDINGKILGIWSYGYKPIIVDTIPLNDIVHNSITDNRIDNIPIHKKPMEDTLNC